MAACSRKPALLALLALALGLPWLAVAARDWLQRLVREEVARSLQESERRLASAEERLGLLERRPFQGPGSRAAKRRLAQRPRSVARGLEVSTSQSCMRQGSGAWHWVRYWYCLGVRFEDPGAAGAEKEHLGSLGVVRVQRPASIGNQTGTFEVLGADGWNENVSDTALAVAAFGDRLAGKHPYRVDTQEGGKASTKMVERAALLRALFSDERFSPNLEWMNTAFAKARKEEIATVPKMLSILAWGSLRTVLYTLSRKKPGDCMYLQKGFVEFALIQGSYGSSAGLPLAGELFRFLEEHPQALAERNSDGETLLMEFTRVPSNASACFRALLNLYEMYNVPVTDLNKRGETAAMLAVMEGRGDWARLLEEDEEVGDRQNTQWLFRNEYPALSAAATHGGILIVALAFFACRPEAVEGRIGGGVAFALKIAILITVNCLLKYGKHLLALLFSPADLVGVSWVGGIRNNHCLQFTLLLGFLGLSGYDFLQAKAPSFFKTCAREKGPLPKSVQVSSIYEDPAVPTYVCIHSFLLSCVFVSFYIAALMAPIKTTYYTRFLWAAALFVQVHLSTKGHTPQVEDVSSGLKELVRWTLRLDEENRQLWRVLFHDASLSSGKQQLPRLSKAEVAMRFAMCYLANGFFKILTLYTLPHYLAGSTKVSDFVLHAFSVQFIYKLDDLASPKTYQVEQTASLEEDSNQSDTDSDSEDGMAFVKGLPVLSSREA